jgi:MFS family permease
VRSYRLLSQPAPPRLRTRIAPLALHSPSFSPAQLAIWRGLLGFGVGGEYPLASTISSEGSKSGSRGRSVATVFSMQGWGKVAAAVINYAVISTCTYYGGTLAFDGTWRVSLALGCLPNILTLYFRWRLHESEIYSKQKKAETGVDGDTLVVTTEDAAHHKHKHFAALPFSTTLAVLWEYKWTLLGTAGSWFLIDVTFYVRGGTGGAGRAGDAAGSDGEAAYRQAAVGDPKEGPTATHQRRQQSDCPAPTWHRFSLSTLRATLSATRLRPSLYLYRRARAS